MPKARTVMLVLCIVILTAPLVRADGQVFFVNAPTWVFDFYPVDVPGASETVPGGINNHNEIAGTFADSSSYQMFVLSSGVFTRLGMSGALTTQALDINDRGDLVGFVQFPEDHDGFQAMQYVGGAFSLLPVPRPRARRSQATGIDKNGTIVGWYTLPPIDPFDPNGATTFGFITPGPADDVKDVAYVGNNDAGHLLGGEVRTGRQFLMTATGTTTIAYPGALFTLPDDVNNLDTVVGAIVTAGNVWRGFISTNGKYARIDYPGAANTQVTGINDRGVVVGSYVNPSSDLFSHGFAAVPRSPVDLTINGADGPVTLDRSQPLRVELKFIAPPDGSLNPAELYVGVAGPAGLLWLDGARGTFTTTPARAFAGALPGFGPVSVINLPNALAVPSGTWTWFAVVDDDSNNVLNATFYDIAKMVVP